jgi:dimethylamine monooxygenase subunit B
VRLTVARTADPAPGIREITLVSPDGARLPAAPPGAHVVVECGEARNAYSLVGTDPYVLAVRAQGAGSRWLHRLAAGDRVEVSAPRSTFAPVRTARRHLLVAGGIGVTPLLAHAREAVRWGREVRMVYVHRAGAYAAELRALLGDRLREPGRAGLDAALELRDQPLGTHLAVCGPVGLMDHVVAAAERAGWPRERVHLERFAPEALEPGRPFTARLRDREVPVPAGQSLLAALEAAGVPVPNQCRQGVCGECRLPVRAGRALHRDEFLAPDEHGTAIMPCVSRAESDVLELDL